MSKVTYLFEPISPKNENLFLLNNTDTGMEISCHHPEKKERELPQILAINLQYLLNLHKLIHV